MTDLESSATLTLKRLRIARSEANKLWKLYQLRRDELILRQAQDKKGGLNDRRK